MTDNKKISIIERKMTDINKKKMGIKDVNIIIRGIKDVIPAREAKYYIDDWSSSDFRLYPLFDKHGK